MITETPSSSRFERLLNRCVVGVIISFSTLIITAIFWPIAWLVMVEMAVVFSLGCCSLVLRHLANEELGL